MDPVLHDAAEDLRACAARLEVLSDHPDTDPVRPALILSVCSGLRSILGKLMNVANRITGRTQNTH